MLVRREESRPWFVRLRGGGVMHIMLDVETLGVRPGHIVLSAALVRFSDFASTAIGLDTTEQATLGLLTDPSTLEWWQGQSEAARAAAFGAPVPLRTGLQHIADWLAWARAGGELTLWCHGASFDAPMLEEVYRRTDISCPWSYRDLRDTRTLFDLAGISLRDFSNGGDHIALADAEAQTRAAIEALRVLAGRQVAA
jgi:hypothetical protein